MNRIQKVLGSLAIAAALAVAPLAASAATVNASSSSSVSINPNGIVRVIGADVTAVSSGIVDAVAHFGSALINFIVNASATTKIAANGSANASTTGIKVGDKVSFVGSLSSSVGNTLTVAASKIRDLTSLPFRHFGGGVVSSVNVGAGTFVITHGDQATTVQTNASTTFSVNGATTTLGSLQTGEKVNVVGTANADGSVITASSVVVKVPDTGKEEVNENSNADVHEHEGNADASTSASVTAGVHENEGSSGGHAHAGLNLLGGLHLGHNN